MSKFKVIEETVEAFYWTGGEDQTEDPIWFLEEMEKGNAKVMPEDDYLPVLLIIYPESEDMYNSTLRGWVVKHECGRLTLCDDETFRLTYAAVSE